MATTWDFTIDQGATFKRTITVELNGDLLDLTGYSARMQFRRGIPSSVVEFELTSNDDLTLGGAAGTIAMLIDAETTAAMSFNQWVYDLELVEPDGEVIRLLSGRATLSREVTR